MAILLLVVALIYLPPVQRFLSSELSKTLSENYNTHISIQRVGITFPLGIIIEEVYVEGQMEDTLLYSESLRVDITPLYLLNKKIVVSYIRAENMYANVYRETEEAGFNYDFFLPGTDDTEKEPAVQDTMGNGWIFIVEEIELNHIRLSYKDQPTDNSALLYLGNLHLDFDVFDIDRMRFEIAELALNNTSAKIYTGTLEQEKEEEPDETETHLPYLSVRELILNNVSLDYGSTDQTLAEAEINHFALSDAVIDLNLQKVYLSKIRGSHNHFHYSAFIDQSDPEENKSKAKETENKEWDFSLGKIHLQNFSFAYNNLNKPDTIQGFDPHNLNIDSLSLIAENIYYSQDFVEASLQHFSFLEKTFQLKDFSFDFYLDSISSNIMNLSASTAESKISGDIKLKFPSLQKITERPGELHLDLNLSLKTGFSDIAFFQPELMKNPVIAANQGRTIDLNTTAKGYVSDLSIPALDITYGENTALQASANLKNLPEAENLVFQVNLKHFESTDVELRRLLSDSIVPKEIQLPSQFHLSGIAQGKANDFSADFDLSSTLGEASVKMNLKHLTDTLTKEIYTAELRLNDINLGAILNQPGQFGKFSLTASLNGEGFDPEQLFAEFVVAVDELEMNQYNYHNIHLSGNMDRMRFTGDLTVDDPNLDFNFSGYIDMSEEAPDIDVLADIKGMDLKALNFTEDEIRIRAKIFADLTGDNINNLNGELGVRDFVLIKDDVGYRVDSLIYASLTGENRTVITLSSEVISGSLTGNVQLDKLGEVFENFYKRYYDPANAAPSLDLASDTVLQEFRFNLTVHNAELITEVLVPGLKEMSEISIAGEFNNRQNHFSTRVLASHIDYDDIVLDSIVINISSDEHKIDYALNVFEISSSRLMLHQPAITGVVANNVVLSRLRINDEAGVERFILGTSIIGEENRMIFSLIPNQLVIDYEPWMIPGWNRLIITGNNKIIAEKFRISKDESAIEIRTPGAPQKELLELEFNTFDLALISHIIENEEDFIRGTLDGNIDLKNYTGKSPFFASNLNIDFLQLWGNTIGNVSILAHNPSDNIVQLHAEITGHGNEMELRGRFNSETSAINLDANIQSVDLSAFDGMADEYITRLSGTISGEVLVSGTTEKPEISGELNFRETRFQLQMLNSYFTLENERINFDQKGVHFDSFTLLDTLDNKAVMSGYILTTDYENFSFELNVATNDFVALSSTEGDNELYYGNIILDSDVRIRGTMDAPVVDASIKLKRGTNLTVIIPETEVAAVEREGIVEFVAPEQNGIEARMASGNDTLRAEMTGIDMRATIEIDDQTSFRIIIDESSGDYLQVQGGATIGFGIDPSGNITLTGRYEINEGSYQLTFYNLVRREFSIRPGSTITWMGDPLDAMMDISAIYNIRTSPMELLADQTAAMTPQDRNRFRQLLPFQVYLNLEGQLLRPDISFNLDIADERRGALDGMVNARLQQLNETEAERNKQAFALLVLNRFLAEDPLEATGAGLTGTARASASRILAQQLNQIAGRYIQGVDITFDVESYEDYETGEAEGRTELQVELSRQFFDDRLTVEVGGRVDVEGERRRQQAGASDIAGDVAVEYSLTEDGVYRLRGFRRNEFQALIDGDIIETGLALIFIRDYNQIRELFRRKETEDEKRGTDIEVKDGAGGGIKEEPGKP
jgi:translocation and assembly module TamB